MNMSKKESTLKLEFPETEEEIAKLLYGDASTWIYTRDNLHSNEQNCRGKSQKKTHH